MLANMSNSLIQAVNVQFNSVFDPFRQLMKPSWTGPKSRHEIGLHNQRTAGHPSQSQPRSRTLARHES
jgi:hypothetical protein